MSSRPQRATGSGSQASSSSGVTTPKKTQVDEQPSNQPTEQPSTPGLQPHFRCKSEFLVHQSCHMDAPLADNNLEWQQLRDVTAKYLYRPSLFHWLKECRQVDSSGIITYPWQGSALTATRWSDWKIVRIGPQGNAQACIVRREAAFYALFMVWQKAGLGEAISARWVSSGNPTACASCHRHGHGPQLFFLTICSPFRRNNMMLTKMGRTARHYWRQAQHFWEVIGAQ